MLYEESDKKVFDAEAASSLVKDLRESFGSGRTQSYEWRVSQVKAVLNLVVDNEQLIMDALRSDLARPPLETVAYEDSVVKGGGLMIPPFNIAWQDLKQPWYVLLQLGMVKNSCEVTLKELKQWMKPEKVKTPIATFPSSAEIVPEPLGSFLSSKLLKSIIEMLLPYLSVLPVLSLDPVIGAIAAGNAVVLKPSEIAPSSSSLLAKLLKEYMDSSCIRVVEGQLMKHLHYWSKSGTKFSIQVDALKTELEKFFGNNPLESKDLSRIVNSYHFARLMKLLDDDKVSGKIVYGGEKDESKLRIAPTILLDVPRDSLIMSEEIFGPLLPILTVGFEIICLFAFKVNKLEECVDIINSGTKPLAIYLFTTNKKLKEQFVMTVSAGGLVVNDVVFHVMFVYLLQSLHECVVLHVPLLVVHTLPYGGVGESGMGAYHGKFSFDSFNHKKAVLYRSFIDVSIKYPPYTDTKLRLMKVIIGGGILRIILALFR
ncbi:hypothetical protein RIF29_11705 [Crotalaria pallida]|uniref:Aldehyde dehydrogenase n=1 Tax=Crotalaria pallida TaxID=3830 RepID=A0AAN9IMF5_CROPI